MGYNKAFITFEQIIKHEDYILDIYDKFWYWSTSYYSRKDSRYNSLNKSIYLKTYNSELLYLFVNMFLSVHNKKKFLLLDIEKYLNPITLPYCDDGQQVKKGGITLCTDNYTLK